MDALDSYMDPLRSYMSADFLATRKSLGLTQAQMAELLDIDLRSYADLEHGKNLCCTRVLLLYLLRCRRDRDGFLDEIGTVLKTAEGELAG